MNFAIIQARMNSTRLPGKVMMKIDDEPMLSHVIRQTLASKMIDDVIIATTTSFDDKIIVDFCKKNHLRYFVGSSDDVLDRFYQCAKKFKCDPVIRISADSPLIDPTIIDRVLTKFLNNSYDYISNNIEKVKTKWIHSTCNFPIGTVVEISSFDCLKHVWKNSKLASEREHVFSYVQSNSKLFLLSNIKSRKKLSHIRITVDKKNDLKFIRKLFSYLPKNKHKITIKDIEKIVLANPKLIDLNKNTVFDEGYKKSLNKDKKTR